MTNLIHIQSPDGGFHTVDESLFTEGGWTLDAGCAEYDFALEVMKRFKQKVIAIDPMLKFTITDLDPDEQDIVCYRQGLAAYHDIREFFEDTKDPFVSRFKKGTGNWEVCGTITGYMKLNKVKILDCVKLDIEGTEYEVIENWPGPVAKQITVEFHDSTPDSISTSDAYLKPWYDKVWATPQDTLYVLRSRV